MKQDAAQQNDLERLRISKGQRPDSRGRTWIVLAVVVLIVVGVGLGAAWWYYQTTGRGMIAAFTTQPVVVRVYEIPRQPVQSNGEVALVANGKIVSDTIVNVATKVSGQITSLHVEQGDTVEKDQVLARIEVDVYEAQRDEARATVDRLKHSVERAQAEHIRQLAAIDQAKAEYEWRKYNHGRLQRLRTDQRASDMEIVEAQHAYEAATAALEVARATADSTLKSVSVIEAELAAAGSSLRLWQKWLDDCAIRAPIAGVVLERNAQVGDFLAAEGGRGANANAQLVSIADMSQLRVEVDISERDIHRVYSGQKARITPDAYKSDAYDGHVMWIDPIGDYARAIVQVKVRIENPTPQLRIEGSAKVEFFAATEDSTDASPQRNWLPLETVKIPTGEGEARVFTVIDGRAAANVVTIGARTNKLVEVLTGVYPGMKIVADRLEEIEEGTPINVQGAFNP